MLARVQRNGKPIDTEISFFPFATSRINNATQIDVARDKDPYQITPARSEQFDTSAYVQRKRAPFGQLAIVCPCRDRISSATIQREITRNREPTVKSFMPTVKPRTHAETTPAVELSSGQDADSRCFRIRIVVPVEPEMYAAASCGFRFPQGTLGPISVERVSVNGGAQSITLIRAVVSARSRARARFFLLPCSLRPPSPPPLPFFPPLVSLVSLVSLVVLSHHLSPADRRTDGRLSRACNAPFLFFTFPRGVRARARVRVFPFSPCRRIKLLSRRELMLAAVNSSYFSRRVIPVLPSSRTVRPVSSRSTEKTLTNKGFLLEQRRSSYLVCSALTDKSRTWREPREILCRHENALSSRSCPS